MAQIENIAETGGNLRATLEPLDEPELMAQQIVQQGAVHALETLLAHGCTEQTAQDMLASLRSNMLVIEAVARDKGFTRLFAERDDASSAPACPESGKHCKPVDGECQTCGELEVPLAGDGTGHALPPLPDSAYPANAKPLPDDAAAHASAVASWKKAAANMVTHWKASGPTVEAQWCTHAAQLLSMGGELMPDGVQAVQPTQWPAGLLDRVKAAEQRIRDNHAPRRIPADPHGDVDLVLAEVRHLIEGTWPPFWIKDADGVQASRPLQPTPYGLAGIEGHAIVIRLTADACAFAFANDPQAREPRPPVVDKQQFLRDTLSELTAEREDGSTPLTDMLDRAMVKAMENGSDALDHAAAGVLVCQACAGDAPGGKCQRPRCVGGPIVEEIPDGVEGTQK